MNMPKHIRAWMSLLGIALGVSLNTAGHADEFTKEDLQRWEQEYMSVVQQGEKLFHGGLKSKNAVSCDQCHPNAANTHPETYPKFQQQLGKVAQLSEMVNWCIENPQGGKALEANSADLIALEAYSFYLHKGVPVETGLQTRQTAGPTPRSARGLNVKGTGIGFDK